MTSEYRLLEVEWLKNMWRPDSFFKVQCVLVELFQYFQCSFDFKECEICNVSNDDSS